MTLQEAFDEINKTQDDYVGQLISLILSSSYSAMKTLYFTSATGTGKTKMMSKLINQLPQFYFIITTLSKGQLHMQVRSELLKDCVNNNFIVYGSADYRINSILEAKDILAKIPTNTQCIWLRDEGHIRTNRYEELLADKCFKVINFSATNVHSDIHCNFAHTMMLRTVNQTTGTPQDAIRKLLEVKNAHKRVQSYNPCAIFRCVGNNESLLNEIIRLCNKHKLKYINITDESFVMSELCEDDNEYDVIINKFKIVEGIDIRRAHVLYMDNQPNNNATTIQAIGRCRRNALLYRKDLDILAPENSDLLYSTRECYVYYNVVDMKIDTDENGELYYAFCDHISCEALKPNTRIHVDNGRMTNGLYVIELEGQTGDYNIVIDSNTGFNVIKPTVPFYGQELQQFENCLYISRISELDYGAIYYLKVKYDNIPLFPTKLNIYDSFMIANEHAKLNRDAYYHIVEVELFERVSGTISPKALLMFKKKLNSYSVSNIEKALMTPKSLISEEEMKADINKFISRRHNTPGYKRFCHAIENLNKKKVRINNQSKYVYLDSLLDSRTITQIAYYCVSCNKKRGERFSFDEVYAIVDDCLQLNYNLDSWVKRFFKTRVTSRRSVLERPVFDITEDNISEFFDGFDKSIEIVKTKLAACKFDKLPYLEISKTIYSVLQNQLELIADNIIPALYVSYERLFDKVSIEEELYIKRRLIDVTQSYTIRFADLEIHGKYLGYTKIYNDSESAIIGTDLMHQIKSEGTTWVEDKAVSSKINKYTKLNTFLTNNYQDELIQAKKQYIVGHNSFDLDKKCNSMLGYCVEYYSKYIVYGSSFLYGYIRRVIVDNDDIVKRINYSYYKWSEEDFIEYANKHKEIIVRACMLKYKDTMALSFGMGVKRFIKGISIDQLIKQKYKTFVDLVVELGMKTADFVKKTLYTDRKAIDNIDPNLSIKHINGLADYITEDTILDVKVRNYIDEKSVRQVLAYHYLSKKRTDLKIKRVIVFDATSGKNVTIAISEKNLSHL